MTRSHPLIALLLAGCGGGSSNDEGPAMEEIPDRFVELAPAAPKAAPPPEPEAAARDKGEEGRAQSQLLSGLVGTRGGAGASRDFATPAPGGNTADGSDDDAEKRAGGEAPAARTRAWFPETFLFQPQLVTDASGKAELSVTVPDRLTTWRVLALAHDRQGGLAGATHSFDGRLPVSVEPVTPPFLVAGDIARLPIQVVNTTDAPMAGQLRVAVAGASLVDPPGRVFVPARSSATAWAQVRADQSGAVGLRVELGPGFSQGDVVERTFTVEPSGRPVVQARAGTLGAARAFEVVGPADLDPASARATVVVHPGALSVIRSELAHAAGRPGIAGTAHALLLGGRGAALLDNLGFTVKTDGPPGPERAAGEALTLLSLRAGQDALRAARSAAPAVGLLLAAPALHTPDNAAVQRLGEKLRADVVRAQRPDGSFSTGGPQAMQQMLVTTAAAVDTLRRAAAAPTDEPEVQARRARDAELARVRASAVFERQAGALTEPYTIATALAARVVDGELAGTLRTRLVAATVQHTDGRRTLPVGPDAVRLDGTRPTEAEATALAALALHGDAPAEIVAELGAGVLSSWRPGAGWGDGYADLRGLQAVLTLFADPLPESVEVTLSRDGEVVASRSLTGPALRDLATLSVPAPDAAGAHTWEIAASPAVPGLGFAFQLETWVPWTPEAGPGGLDLAVTPPARAVVGQPALVRVEAAAPARRALTVRLPLPPSVQVDTDALDRAVRAGRLTGYDAEDGLLTLDIPALGAGESFAYDVPIVPMLSGSFHPAPAELAARTSPDTPRRTAPQPWFVRPR